MSFSQGPEQSRWVGSKSIFPPLIISHSEERSAVRCPFARLGNRVTGRSRPFRTSLRVSVCICALATTAVGQEVVLTPEKVVEFAQRNSTAILDAKYEVEKRMHARGSAAAAFKPKVAVRTSYTHLDEPPAVHIDNPFLDGPVEIGPQDRWSVGYTVTQPIFSGGRLIMAHRAARLRHESAQLALERTAQEVRSQALRMFWTYVQVRQTIATAEETVVWLERLVDDLSALVQAGIVVEHEVLQMRTRLALAKLNVVRTANVARTRGEQLLLLCNLPLHNTLVVDSSVLDMLEHNPDLSRPNTYEVISERSDVRAMQLEADALDAARKAQALSYVPSLVGVFNQAVGNSDPLDYDRPENEWSATVALDWNIIDWGAARNARDEIGAAAAQVRLALDAKKRAIDAAIRAARRKVEVAFQAQQLALESVDNAQRALRNADARYREGLITGTELLDYSRDLTTAREELIRARIEKVLAVEENRAAVGE